MKNLITTIAATLALAGVASAQIVDPERPETVVRALQDLGYRAVLTTDSVGDPMVQSSINGWDYAILFYDCEDNTNCGTMQFTLGFDLPDGASSDAVSEYNRRHLVGKVFLDQENDPFLKWLVSGRGGLTRSNFVDVLSWWKTGVNDFERLFPFPSNQ